MGSHIPTTHYSEASSSLAMSLLSQGGISFLLLVVGTVSGMDPGTSSISLQMSMLDSQLSTLGSQLIQIQEQVEVLQQENMEDKERIIHLEGVTEEFQRRLSLLESVCGSAEMEQETDTSDEEEVVTMSTNIISTSIESRPVMAIGGRYGFHENGLRSAKVLNTSCDFPLPEARYNHISVTTTDGKTLVCGGSTSSDWTASCLQFDYDSWSWKQHSTLLSRYRENALAVTLSRGTYVLGGLGSVETSSEFLATGSSVWTQGPHIPGEGVHNSCVAKLSDTEFVILGGFDGTQARVYNVESDEWREWPRLNEEVLGGHSCVGLKDKVLM